MFQHRTLLSLICLGKSWSLRALPQSQHILSDSDAKNRDFKRSLLRPEIKWGNCDIQLDSSWLWHYVEITLKTLNVLLGKGAPWKRSEKISFCELFFIKDHLISKQINKKKPFIARFWWEIEMLQSLRSGGEKYLSTKVIFKEIRDRVTLLNSSRN